MTTASSSNSSSTLLLTRRVVTVLLLLFVFMVGIKGMGSGFKLLGRDVLDAFFTATENPFVGLVVGILATTLVQSSSVTTSMIVGMVAAPANPLPLANAVPMVMGANIGTTVTNTMVALAHMRDKEEFRRAFSAATVHDFFNLITVAVLLPLELATGFLSRSAAGLAGLMGGLGGVAYKSPLKTALKAGAQPIKDLAHALFHGSVGQAAVVLLLSVGLIILALTFLVWTLRGAMGGRMEGYLDRALGSNPVVSMIIGAVMTVSVQSSSITTSLLVPLAGAGAVTLRSVFPVTLGANVGTTVTALLASMAVSGPNATFGVQIALVHLLFNVCGILLIYPSVRIREVPLRAATWLADAAVRSRLVAVAYVVGVFYVLPGVLIFADKAISG